ncbi:DUF3761 domain-containing protein [Streptomyces yunnanensis]|uniref:DUF3761 domain-containing protein n=1 Tax=Streptomyces yunnanensis TaxID=156453 RepID=A0A9X8MTH2_9ACTN|nr:DUF3761 domain-containing protein [Streptomyces yunnanensis]SHL76411.1 Protein of unknown function [Streptomyces yunnanensis]
MTSTITHSARRIRSALAAATLAAAAIAPVTIIAGTAQAATVHCAHHTTGVCGTHIKHPSGVMAKCKDGTWSYSKRFSGTCSHHRGVRYWFK